MQESLFSDLVDWQSYEYSVVAALGAYHLANKKSENVDAAGSIVNLKDVKGLYEAAVVNAHRVIEQQNSVSSSMLKRSSSGFKDIAEDAASKFVELLGVSADEPNVLENHYSDLIKVYAKSNGSKGGPKFANKLS